MKKKLILAVISIFVLAAAIIGATSAWAETGSPPSQISYQGFVRVGGEAYNGTGYFKFAFVSGPEGDGTIYWQTGPETLNVSQGLFDFMLGSTTALPSEVLENDPLYLRVWFSQAVSGPFQALEPNQRIGSVAYALRAEYALTAGDADTLDGQHADELTQVKQLIYDFTVAAGESINAGDVVSYLNDGVEKGWEAAAFGSEYALNTGNPANVSAAALSADTFVVAYSGYNTRGMAVIGQVDGTAITYGSEQMFNAQSTGIISVAALSADTFVVAYQNLGNSWYGTAIIGQVAGDTITFGNTADFNTAPTQYISAAALSADTFVVAYADMDNSWHGTAVIGQVSGGTTITFGSGSVFNTAQTYCSSVAALSTDRFIVAYYDTGAGSGMAIVGQVDGTTITFGSEYVLKAASIYNISVAALSAAKFVAAYTNEDDSDNGTLVIGEVDGTALTFGSEQLFNALSTGNISLAALSTDSFVAAYSGNDDYGTAVIGQVDGTNITFDSEYGFNTTRTCYSSVAVLSADKLVAAYSGNDDFGTAVIGQVDGTALAFGSGYVFNIGNPTLVSAAALSADTFVAAYSGNHGYGWAVIGQVNGTAITFGPEQMFSPLSIGTISVAALSADTFVVAFQDLSSSWHGTAVIGQVSGDTITFGNTTEFNSAPTQYISVAALSADTFVVAYADMNNSWYGTAVIGQVSSGTSITFGTAAVFNPVQTYYSSVAALFSDRFIAAYYDTGTGSGMAVVGQVSGTAITFGSEYVLRAASIYNLAVAALSADSFVAAYTNEDNADNGMAVIGRVSGTAIDFGSEYVFNSASTQRISLAALSAEKFVVVYTDEGNADNRTAIIGDVSSAAISFNPESVLNTTATTSNSVAALSSDKFVAACQVFGNFWHGAVVIGEIPGNTIVGIAGETHTAGENIPVIISGISDVHSGLTPGTVYYCDPSGGLTTIPNDYKVGLAVSTTDILLDLN